MEPGRKLCTLSQAIVLSLIGVVSALTCDPAAEEMPYDIQYNMTSIPSESRMFVWMKDGNIAFECTVASGDCSHNDIPWLKASTERVDDSLIFNIHFPRVTRQLGRNSEGVWSLHSHTSHSKQETFYTCNLKVYAAPSTNTTHCESTWSASQIYYSCNTTKSYPRSLMAIRWYNEISLASCKYAPVSVEPVYYNAQCSTSLKTEKLHLTPNDFNIFVYPNVTGTQKDFHFGISLSAVVNIVRSSVIQRQCLEDGLSINCSCKKLEPLDDSALFLWHNGDQLVSSKPSNMHAFKKGTSNITCEELVPNQHRNDIVANGLIVGLSICVFLIALFVVFIVLILCSKRVRSKFPDKFRNYMASRFDADKTIPNLNNPAQEQAHLPQNKEEMTSNELNIESAGFVDVAKKVAFNDPLQTQGKLNKRPNNYETKENDDNEEMASLLPNETQVDSNYEGSTNAKTVILLLGTPKSNKHLLRNEILRNEEKISKLPDKSNTTSLAYSSINGKVTKLVDVPITDDVTIDEDKENLKSAVAIIPEGYNAIIVVLAIQDIIQSVQKIEKLLNDNFCMESVIFIVTYKDDLLETDPYKTEYEIFRNKHSSRLLTMNINGIDIRNVLNMVNTQCIHRDVKGLFAKSVNTFLTTNDILLEGFMIQLCSIMQILNDEKESNTLAMRKEKQNLLSLYDKLNSNLSSECEDIKNIITKTEYKHQGKVRKKVESIFEEIQDWFLKDLLKARKKHVKNIKW
ncbi:uncharacterized protein LOC131939363 [Physella acuta]|uniref:uncharacterized protein LOC131939363 n=1 Tax=Physella acuta TaxID=109671 RepID=UPI0027DB2DD1|nr:uncharacterized protein LOC131939363 [Physella acuta]XP_059153635.1 uncharacterized protein LOC131939363 [Physella acuta]